MAIHGSQLDRIATLERDIRQLTDRLAQTETRSASTPKQRQGRWLAILTADLEAGGSAFAEIYAYDGTSITGMSETVTVWDWFLQEEETITSGHKVYIVFLSDSRWYVVAAECE